MVEWMGCTEVEVEVCQTRSKLWRLELLGQGRVGVRIRRTLGPHSLTQTQYSPSSCRTDGQAKVRPRPQSGLAAKYLGTYCVRRYVGT